MTPVEKLELFVKRAEELGKSTFLQSDFVPHLQAERTGTEPASTNLSEPDEDVLRSFLMAYRPFISDRDPVFISMIFNLCYQHITDSKDRALIVEMQAAWKALQKGERSGLQLVEKGKQLLPAETQDLWINGYYFHPNHQEKSKRLSELSEGFQEAFRYQFLEHVYESARIILFVANQATHALSIGAVS